MSKIKAILFDLDGTLIDSSEGITKSAQYALKHYGIEARDLDKLKIFIGPPLMYSFTKHYNFSQEQAREAVGVYRERYNVIGIFECSLYPHVKECIEELKNRGYRIGLASSKPEGACKRILTHFGILDLFDEVVGSTPDGTIDTKEEVLKELLRRWSDISVDEMCLIGDTLFDVEGANQVGIQTLVVSFGFGKTDEMLEAGAKAVCNDLIGLPELIKEVFH